MWHYGLFHGAPRAFCMASQHITTMSSHRFLTVPTRMKTTSESIPAATAVTWRIWRCHGPPEKTCNGHGTRKPRQWRSWIAKKMCLKGSKGEGSHGIIRHDTWYNIILYVYVYIYMYVIYIYIFIYLFIYLSINIYKIIYVCVCVCVFVYGISMQETSQDPRLHNRLKWSQFLRNCQESKNLNQVETLWDFMRLEIFWGFQMDVPKGSSGSSCLWHPLRLQPQLHQPQQTQGAEDAGNSDDLSSGFTHNVCDMYVTCNYVTCVCVCHHEKSIMKRNKGNPGKLMLWFG